MERVTGFDSAGVLGLHFTPDRAIAKNRACRRVVPDSMHWRASSAHHRCLGPFGATRVLVTHHRLHLLELLEVEVSALAAEGGGAQHDAL